MKTIIALKTVVIGLESITENKIKTVSRKPT
jgi:hypothetical protein